MQSLRGRLTLTIAGLALLAVVVTTVAVAVTTSDALEGTLAEQREAEAVITETLNIAAFEVETWPELQPTADDLAEDFEARIVLTDVDGRRLIDTGAGNLPPIEGVIDPFGALAEFGETIPPEVELFNDALRACLEEEGIPYELDEFGDVFVVDGGADDLAVGGCYDFAAVSLSDELSGIKEPALLFIGFSVTPSVPWVLIAVIAAGVIVIAAGAATGLSGYLTKPLQALASAARAVRQGDLDVRVDAVPPSEVADLADSFNDMTEELARAEVRRRQLTADVAHELRSPLTNILSHLDAIDDGVIEPTPDQIQIVTSEALRLTHLVDDLQTLAAMDGHSLTLHPAPTDLTRVVDVAIEARQGRALEKDITVVREGHCGDVTVDRKRFDQIVGNLLDNALEHTPDGGTVAITMSDGAAGVEIAVSDTGPGIDDDLLPYVFDRLSRADTSRTPGHGGRGLGLAIARGLARAHGGDISAENLAGGGARFVVRVPRG